MESESDTLNANGRLGILARLTSPLVPVLFIAISYVDPGKWAAAAEGGARFGVDLVLLVFVFSSAAILCQYLSACIAVATGRDLAQICSKEYDKITCFFLGFQAEFSMILLDLTMVLGTAHGLNAVLGIDLFTCIYLTIVAPFLFPLLAILLENGRATCMCICLSSGVLLSYFFGVLMSQPESSFSLSGIATKLSGESAFALMALLGASIMPHNFYLHSSIVQNYLGPADRSKEAVCYDHLFATVCIFSGIFLVNFVLMTLAANVFYSAGLVLVNFQDALSLLDQVYRSSLVPFSLVLILFFSNQFVALTWNHGRQIVIYDFFGVDIPGWLHYATIRITSIVPALCCVWIAGAEGIYQLLIFAQVLVALMLPSSVIPLFRVASSRSIMGACKISRFVEFMSLFVYIGMIGMKIVFVIEMVFGDSDWASNLRWSTGSNVPIPYVILLLVASISFCFMLWLAATPLKSAGTVLDVHEWDLQSPLPEPVAERYQSVVRESSYHLEKPMKMQEPASKIEKSLDNIPDEPLPLDDLNLPETLLDSESILHVIPSETEKSEVQFPSVGYPEVLNIKEKVLSSPLFNEPSDGVSPDTRAMKSEPEDMVGTTLGIEEDVLIKKGDEDRCEPEDTKEVKTENLQPLTSEGPGSLRNLSGKGDDLGSGTGSLSRLAGLGRAARRQLTLILDDFWGQLFDSYGQPTQEARAKKLDVLLGIELKADAKPSPASLKFENRKELAGYSSSFGGRNSDSSTNPSSFNSPMHQQNWQSYNEPSYGSQQGSSSMWSTRAQLLDAYARNSAHNAYDASERRYSSLRIPASSDIYDQQPATVHGHEFSSYLSQIAKERGANYLNPQIDLLAPKSTSSTMSSYGDPFYRLSDQKKQTSLSSRAPPGFHNVPMTRNGPLQSQRLVYDLDSPKAAEATGGVINEKKYFSLPDISGLRTPQRDARVAGKSSQWDNSTGSGRSVLHSTHDQNSSSTLLRVGAPVGFDELSPSKVCRDAFSLKYNSHSGSGSLWSMQPYEQFGVAGKTTAANGQQAGANQSSNTEETTSAVDLEGKLVSSFRYCILRLLKLEGSDWLFNQNDGVDEDLIDRVAARERFHYELETNQTNRPSNTDPHKKSVPPVKSDELDYAAFSISLNPYCGEGCIYRVDVIVSFGVWCIHRILEFSLVESRPELWGKYTYVLNRLQGIIDPAFFKSRSPMTPCFCLDIPPAWQQRSSTTATNGNLPPPAKIARGKFTTAAMVLDMIKDVEMAIACRKGRSGTAAGDVAFPKGKENLASVLKRYKRRLSNKPLGS